MPDAPRVFVSYSHDSAEHKQWVADLSDKLVGEGLDVIFDGWDLGPGQDVAVMAEQIRAADKVLIVCTPQYVERANGRKRGAGYEATIVTGELLRNAAVDKFIPVIRKKGPGDEYVPAFLSTKVYVDLSDESSFDAEFRKLVRVLKGQPPVERPGLGQNGTATVVDATKNDTSDVEAPVHATLSAEGVALLLKVAPTTGKMLDPSDSITGDTDMREMSKVKGALDELEEHNLMAWVSGSLYRVTQEGFMLADQLLAAGSSLRGEDEDSRRVHQQLQDKQSFDLDGIALEVVIQYISKAAGVNIHTKWASLNAAGVSRDTEVSIRLVGVSVEKALQVILEDVSGVDPLGFYVDDGVITISTRSDLDQS